jgi:hypothetical protein
MHVAVAVGVAVVLTFFLMVVAGATPFVGIPILVVAVGIAALYAVIARRLAERTLDTEAPSSAEASYQPVVDPADRR